MTKAIQYAKTEIFGEQGRQEITYSLLVELIHCKNITLESYGIRIENDRGESDVIRHVSLMYTQVDRLLSVLHRNQVTLLCFRDVMDDLMG